MYNAIPGRYVNRIGYANYTIGDKTYFTEKNDGNNTLHSGNNNWSFRTWNVDAFTAESITFSIHDASNSSQGMLGSVDARVTYSVEDATWKIKMEATSSQAKTRAYIPCHVPHVYIYIRACMYKTVSIANLAPWS